MATQYTYTCDRCKNKTESMQLGPVKIQTRLCARLSFKTESDIMWGRYPREYELCVECREALAKFMSGGADRENTKEEST